MTGFWYHSVDGGPSGLLELREGGRLVGERTEGRWTLEGWRLRLEWPSADAPDGAWIDDCVVSEDGRSYAGRNQNGAVIRGSRRP